VQGFHPVDPQEHQHDLQVINELRKWNADIEYKAILSNIARNKLSTLNSENKKLGYNSHTRNNQFHKDKDKAKDKEQNYESSSSHSSSDIHAEPDTESIKTCQLLLQNQNREISKSTGTKIDANATKSNRKIANAKNGKFKIALADSNLHQNSSDEKPICDEKTLNRDLYSDNKMYSPFSKSKHQNEQLDKDLKQQFNSTMTD